MQLNELVSRPVPPPASPAAAVGGAVMLQATGVRHLGKPRGVAEWLVRFRLREGAQRAVQAPFTRISIAGAPAAHVREVQVHAGEGVVFSLESLEDQHLHRSTAGEILQAMASMAGQPGMCISPVDLGCALVPQDTMVQLRLCSPDLAGVMAVRVVAG